MNNDLKKLFQNLSNKQYAPFYIIDGEEPYYIDMVTQYFEDKILQPAEKDFNLLTLYGKDAEWAEVVNSCRRFPMFAERQVVILKDAAQMSMLNELTAYLESPSPTTIFLIEHRFKKVDGRSRLVKLAKDKGAYFTSDRLKDEQIPKWIEQHGLDINFHIAEREAQILASYLGNDLQKIANEIDKIRINVPEEKTLHAGLIQKYIGISRDYNLFELPVAFTNAQYDKLYRMVSYFTTHAKAAPLPLVIGTFYSHFNTVYQVHAMKGKHEKEISQTLRLFGERLREAITAAQNIPPQKMEECMLLLSSYSAKAVGVGYSAGDRELLKEMIGRLEVVLRRPYGN